MKGRIVVTNHAVSRATERFPTDFPDGPQVAYRKIAGEVGAAVDQGRMAVNLPRFAVRAGCTHRGVATRYGHVRNPGSRYVWTEDQRRLYLVRRQEQLAVVVTTIRPDALTEEAA